jgi:hypothetical protein
MSASAAEVVSPRRGRDATTYDTRLPVVTVAVDDAESPLHLAFKRREIRQTLVLDIRSAPVNSPKVLSMTIFPFFNQLFFWSSVRLFLAE